MFGTPAICSSESIFVTKGGLRSHLEVADNKNRGRLKPKSLTQNWTKKY